MGTHGFASASALLYHRHSPSAIVAVDAVPPPEVDEVGELDHPLVPRHLRTADAAGRRRPGDRAAPAAGERRRDHLLGGRRARAGRSTGTRRATSWSTCSRGRRRSRRVFGALDVSSGDYVVIPSGTTHRWVVTGDGPFGALVVAASGGHVDVPRRYQSDRGQMLEGRAVQRTRHQGAGRPADRGRSRRPGDRPPRGRADPSRAPLPPVRRRRLGRRAVPWALSIHDFEPLVGTIHQPPPIHQTFEGPGFVVCSFTPASLRPASRRGEDPVPPRQRRLRRGAVLLRRRLHEPRRLRHPGRIDDASTPPGFVHGPQPGSLERSLDQERTDELAVMVDTFRRLRVTGAARSVSAPDYHLTWAG